MDVCCSVIQDGNLKHWSVERTPLKQNSQHYLGMPWYFACLQLCMCRPTVVLRLESGQLELFLCWSAEWDSVCVWLAEHSSTCGAAEHRAVQVACCGCPLCGKQTHLCFQVSLKSIPCYSLPCYACVADNNLQFFRVSSRSVCILAFVQTRWAAGRPAGSLNLLWEAQGCWLQNTCSTFGRYLT